MEIVLLMGVSGGDWLPLLGLMIAPMAMLLCIEWLVNYVERSIRKRDEARISH
jgi:purine-cytosine permease-like protein